MSYSSQCFREVISDNKRILCEKNRLIDDTIHRTHRFNPNIVGVQCSSVYIPASPANSSVHGIFHPVVDLHTIVDLEARGFIGR